MPPDGSGARFPVGFATIWTTVALDLVGFGIVLPVLPIYARQLHASPATVGLLFASFSLAQLVLAPVWGRLSDRMGRKPLLLLSLAGTAVGSLLTGLAGSLPLLFAGRIVDGASGASVSVAQASVADLARPDQRARLFGFLGAAFGLGFVAGPAIGALAALGSPALPFFVAAGIAGANALVAVRRLPETHPRGSSGGAVGADGAVAGAAVAGAHRAAGELRRLLVVAFVSLVAFSAFEATFALFGQRYLHFREASTGAVFAVIGLALVAVQTSLVGPAVRRFGESGTVRLGLAVNAGGLLLLALVRSWWLLVPALLALTVGQGLVTPALASRVAAGAGERRRGGALGLQQSAGGLARVVGPAAGGVLFQAQAWTPFVVGAALMGGCALALSGGSVGRVRPAMPAPEAR